MDESVLEDEIPGVGDERFDGADLCVVCLAELHSGCLLCSACKAPVTPEAAMVPWESIFAEGFIYRRAVGMPQSLPVVIGVSLLFSVTTVHGLGRFCDGLSESERLYESLLGTFEVAVGAAALWQCLKNYRNRQAPSAEEMVGH